MSAPHHKQRHILISLLHLLAGQQQGGTCFSQSLFQSVTHTHIHTYTHNPFFASPINAVMYDSFEMLLPYSILKQST